MSNDSIPKYTIADILNYSLDKLLLLVISKYKKYGLDDEEKENANIFASSARSSNVVNNPFLNKKTIPDYYRIGLLFVYQLEVSYRGKIEKKLEYARLVVGNPGEREVSIDSDIGKLLLKLRPGKSTNIINNSDLYGRTLKLIAITDSIIEAKSTVEIYPSFEIAFNDKTQLLSYEKKEELVNRLRSVVEDCHKKRVDPMSLNPLIRINSCFIVKRKDNIYFYKIVFDRPNGKLKSFELSCNSDLGREILSLKVGESSFNFSTDRGKIQLIAEEKTITDAIEKTLELLVEKGKKDGLTSYEKNLSEKLAGYLRLIKPKSFYAYIGCYILIKTNPLGRGKFQNITSYPIVASHYQFQSRRGDKLCISTDFCQKMINGRAFGNYTPVFIARSNKEAEFLSELFELIETETCKFEYVENKVMIIASNLRRLYSKNKYARIGLCFALQAVEDDEIEEYQLTVGSNDDNKVGIHSFLGEALLNSDSIKDGSTISYSVGIMNYSYRIVATAESFDDLQTKVESIKERSKIKTKKDDIKNG